MKRVVTAFCVAAAGTTTRGTCECRIATTTRPTTATTTTVSASPFKLKTSDGFPSGKQFAVVFGNKRK